MECSLEVLVEMAFTYWQFLVWSLIAVGKRFQPDRQYQHQPKQTQKPSQLKITYNQPPQKQKSAG
jgi:hypothetical protein